MERYTQKKMARNHEIDLLRIICMIMVVAIHVTSPILETMEGSTEYWAVFLVKLFCICAVNCYAIISGYVGVETKQFKISKILYLWLTVLFYTSIIAVVVFIAFLDVLCLKDIFKSFLPVYSVQYWYFSSYFLLFFLSPLVNSFFENSNKKQQISVLFGILLMSLGGSFFSAINGLWAINNGYSVLWLLVMYYVGVYLRKNPLSAKTRWLVVYIICIITMFAGELLLASFGQKWIGMLSSYISSITVVAAISFFMLFKNFRIKNRIEETIRLIVPLTFSVCIIHYNKNIWMFLAMLVSKFVQYNIAVVLLFIVFTSVTIFFCCILIDYVRDKIFSLLRIKDSWALAEEKLSFLLKINNSDVNVKE